MFERCAIGQCGGREGKILVIGCVDICGEVEHSDIRYFVTFVIASVWSFRQRLEYGIFVIERFWCGFFDMNLGRDCCGKYFF